MLTVFVSGEVQDFQLEQIRAAAPGADVRYFAGRDALEARIEEAEIVAGNIGAAALARAANLRWVQSWAAGPDALMFPEMIASPVVCTSCKGNGAIPLAEHALMLMLMLNRDAPGWMRAQNAHRWEHRPHAELNGLTCGIIGLGHSGQDLALKCQAFHMRVLGIRRTPRPTPNVDEVFTDDGLHDLLHASDFVVMTAPRTPETVGMLGEAEFRAMKPTAHYVCFSHGAEPLPTDSPFWDLPNVIVTPHNGATTPATRQRGIDIFVENLRRFQAGQPLLNVIDKAAGY